MYPSPDRSYADINYDVQEHFSKATNNKIEAFNYSPAGYGTESISFYGKDYGNFDPSADTHFDRNGQEEVNRKHGKEVFFWLDVDFLHDWIDKHDQQDLSEEAVNEFKSLIDKRMTELAKEASETKEALPINNSAPLEFISNKLVVDTDGTILIQSNNPKEVGDLTYLIDFENDIEGWVIITELEDDRVDYRAATYEELQQHDIEVPKVAVELGGVVEIGNMHLQSEFKLLDELNKTSESNYEVGSLDHSIFQDWPSADEWENVSSLIEDPQLAQLMRYKELANLLSLDTDEVSSDLLTKLDNALDASKARVESQLPKGRGR